MKLDPKLAATIDLHRRRGASYDRIHAHLSQLVPAEQVDTLLAEYSESILPDRRPRGQVNFGDPDER